MYFLSFLFQISKNLLSFLHFSANRCESIRRQKRILAWLVRSFHTRIRNTCLIFNTLYNHLTQTDVEHKKGMYRPPPASTAVYVHNSNPPLDWPSHRFVRISKCNNISLIANPLFFRPFNNCSTVQHFHIVIHYFKLPDAPMTPFHSPFPSIPLPCSVVHSPSTDKLCIHLSSAQITMVRAASRPTRAIQICFHSEICLRITVSVLSPASTKVTRAKRQSPQKCITLRIFYNHPPARRGLWFRGSDHKPTRSWC